MQLKKIAIVDGYSLFFRCCYAMMNLKDENGNHNGGVYGSFKTLIAWFASKKYSHLMVALDGGGRTFRSDIDESYKANRQKAPDEIVIQFEPFEKMIEDLNIKCVRVSGFEADDIIASFGVGFKKNGFDVTVFTSDKDLMQLSDFGIDIYDQKNKKLLSKDDIFNIFGIDCKYMSDYLALVGDAVDNIKGVKGIGAKTAAKLINQFCTVENIYNNIEKVEPEKLKNQLIEGKDDALKSKLLTTLRFELELEDAEVFKFDGFSSELIKKVNEKYFSSKKKVEKEEKIVKEEVALVNDVQMRLI